MLISQVQDIPLAQCELQADSLMVSKTLCFSVAVYLLLLQHRTDWITYVRQ